MFNVAIQNYFFLDLRAFPPDAENQFLACIIKQIVCQHNLFYILYFREQATVNCSLLPLWNILSAGMEHRAGAIFRVPLGEESGNAQSNITTK